MAHESAGGLQSRSPVISQPALPHCMRCNNHGVFYHDSDYVGSVQHVQIGQPSVG